MVSRIKLALFFTLDAQEEAAGAPSLAVNSTTQGFPLFLNASLTVFLYCVMLRGSMYTHFSCIYHYYPVVLDSASCSHLKPTQTSLFLLRFETALDGRTFSVRNLGIHFLCLCIMSCRSTVISLHSLIQVKS